MRRTWGQKSGAGGPRSRGKAKGKKEGRALRTEQGGAGPVALEQQLAPGKAGLGR